MPATYTGLPRLEHSESRPIRIGYLPMTDCAPLVVAHELELFRAQGLEVELCREPGWATVREKMAHGELDACQAPASMVFELSLGLSSRPVPCLTAFVTAHNGNAITLSNELWELGVRDAVSLAACVRRHRHRRFTFAGVLKYSSQHYLMRDWLRSGGLEPDVDVDIVIVPPPQVHACLRAGHLDGYCVAEPWSSAGLLKGIGWCATLTADFDAFHPEKIFMVTRAFHETHPEIHGRLLRALDRAARLCDEPQFRPELAAMLARTDYLDLPREVIANALRGDFDLGGGRTTSAGDAIIFHRYDANRPTAAKGRWVLDAIRRHGLAPPGLAPETIEVSRFFCEPIHDQLLLRHEITDTATTSSSA